MTKIDLARGHTMHKEVNNTVRILFVTARSKIKLRESEKNRTGKTSKRKTDDNREEDDGKTDDTRTTIHQTRPDKMRPDDYRPRPIVDATSIQIIIDQ